MSPHAQCTCLQPQITSTAHKLHYTVHVPVCLDTPVLTLLIPDIQSPISLSLSLSPAILGCTAVALRAHVVTWDMWT